MEKTPDNQTPETDAMTEQELLGRQREKFLDEANALAKKYDVSLEHVMHIFAASEGKQVDEHLNEKELLSALFTEERFRDGARWEMVETKLELELSEKDAITDHLTGLYNRRTLDFEMKRWAETSERDADSEKQKPFSFIFIDIDDFKTINDTFGHAAGDEVLKEVAQKIKHEVRATDFIGRYGGEEIAVVVDGDVEVAKLLAERIRVAIESLDVSGLGIDPDKREKITASLGVSEYIPNGDVDHDLAEMSKRADTALYEAKGSGKNQVRVLM